ncbi:MAG: DUF748 domain-containing protein [Gammaproteobacteria bacterium]|jgi:hypothetical protein|nr:DUF748 domain-containing protein [Gammaproteobacteria bacterium]
MRRRRRRSLEIGRRVLGGLFWTVLLLVSALLALPALMPYGLPWLAARHGIEVALERASYALPGPELRLQGLRIGAAPEGVEARDLRLGVDLRALLEGELRLSNLALEGARLALVPAAEGDGAGPMGVAGYRPVLPPGLALPPTRSIEARDLQIAFPDGRLPEVRLESLRLLPGAAGQRDLEASGTLAGGQFRVDGSLAPIDPGGGELRVRLERLDVERLAAALASVLPGPVRGAVGGEVTVRWSGADEARALEGTLDAVGVAVDLEGLRLADATARWEGTARLEPAGSGGTAVRLTGRLAADRGSLTGPGGTLEVEGLAFEGQTGWTVVDRRPGGWTLDGDGELAHVAARDGPWAGATASQAAFWGLWRGPRRELSMGQLRAARVELPPPRGAGGGLPGRPWAAKAEGLQLRGLSLGDDGLSLDEVGAGPMTVRASSSSDPVTAASVQGTEVVLAPGWARAGSVTVAGLAAPSSRPDVGLEVAEAALLGVRVAGNEGVHLGEVRLRGLALAVSRDVNGDWRGPGVPWPAGEPPTVDVMLVAPGARVDLTDLTTDPVARLALTEVEGRLSARDRTHPGRFAARGSLAGARLDLSGQLGTLGEPAPAAVRAALSQVPLVTFSPYLRAALGRDFTSGTATAEVDARASPRGWEGRARLALSRAEVAPARGTGQGSAWLARGLGLLADGEGRSGVDLALGTDVPLSQSLPEAFVTAVETAYRPLGLTRVQVGQLLREGAFPLSGVPVDAQGQPDSAVTARLEALAAILRAHPGTRVELCGPGTGVEAGAPRTDVEPAVQDTAVDRVRDLLIRTGRVPPDRVDACAVVLPSARIPTVPEVGLTLRVTP